MPRRAPPHAFKPGVPRPANAGRRKGTPNKVTRDMREAVLNAFEKVGGEEYLVRALRGKDSGMRRAVVALFGKTMPNILAGDPNNPVSVDLSTVSASDLKTFQTLARKLGIKAPENTP